MDVVALKSAVGTEMQLVLATVGVAIFALGIVGGTVGLVSTPGGPGGPHCTAALCLQTAALRRCPTDPAPRTLYMCCLVS